MAAAGAALALAGGLSACSSASTSASDASGEELTTLRVALGWITNVEWAGFWIADDAGYYAEEGLEIEWLAGGPNAPTTMASVAAGDADLGVEPSMQNWLQSIPQGNDFVGVGTVYQDTPSALLSLAEDPVESVEDMKGATILGQEGTQPLIDAMFRVGGDEPDYEFVPVGFDVAPLVEGQGKAYTAYATNQPIMLEETYGMSADDYVTLTYAELGLPQYGNVIYGDSSTIEEQSEAIEGFLRASIRGWLENEEDPDLGAQLAVEKYGADLGLDLTQQTRENELQIPFLQSELTEEKGLFWIDPERLAGPMYEGLEAAGVTDLPEVEDILDLSLLEKVYADGPLS